MDYFCTAMRPIIVVAALLAPMIGFSHGRFLLGYSSFSFNQTPVWAAKEKGLIEGVIFELVILGKPIYVIN